MLERSGRRKAMGRGLAAMQILSILVVPLAGRAAAEPADSDGAILAYTGTDQPDKHYYDGRLRHAAGVHRYQAFRADRSMPPTGGVFTWTYNHQPYLAYWKGQFYLQYLSDPKEEHVPPGRTLLVTSKNGRDWTVPHVVFPVYP